MRNRRPVHYLLVTSPTRTLPTIILLPRDKNITMRPIRNNNVITRRTVLFVIRRRPIEELLQYGDNRLTRLCAHYHRLNAKVDRLVPRRHPRTHRPLAMVPQRDTNKMRHSVKTGQWRVILNGHIRR